jgi:hypothetical protein
MGTVERTPIHDQAILWLLFLVWQSISQGFFCSLGEEPSLHDIGKGDCG